MFVTQVYEYFKKLTAFDSKFDLVCKLLLLSRTEDLIFVLKSSTEYNIDFIYCKKGK